MYLLLDDKNEQAELIEPSSFYNQFSIILSSALCRQYFKIPKNSIFARWNFLPKRGPGILHVRNCFPKPSSFYK